MQLIIPRFLLSSSSAHFVFLKIAVNCFTELFLSFKSHFPATPLSMLMMMMKIQAWQFRRIGGITTSIQLSTVDRFLMNRWTISKTNFLLAFFVCCALVKKINSILKEFSLFYNFCFNKIVSQLNCVER